MDDQECSELCSCSTELALTCHALCVPLVSSLSPYEFSIKFSQKIFSCIKVPCRTSLAYYSHAAPAYQAFRGRCLCYSGRFICMRPPPGEYKVKSIKKKSGKVINCKGKNFK
jgi:hypothetical protein